MRVLAPDDEALESTVFFLRAGDVVAIPTDTLYGLAVDPTVPGATQKLFDAKGRGRDVPIAVLVDDERQASSICSFPPAAVDLAVRWWPGALTLVVPRTDSWTADIGDAPGTIGVRAPDHDWVRALCRAVGPLATTSANLHGQPALVTADAVVEAFGDVVALVIDGGELSGLASTVVDCTGPEVRVVRQGAVEI